MKRPPIPGFPLLTLLMGLGACSAPEFVAHKAVEDHPAMLQERLQDGLAGRLRGRLTEFMNDRTIHGLQVSLLAGGDVHHLALGSEDPHRAHPVTTRSVFRIGSVSKTLTALIILRLAEAGTIDLDARISTWFPDFPNGERITVRQLLNHTSGIYNYTTSWLVQLKLILSDGRVWRFDEFYDAIRRGTPYFPPGDAHFYSNSNYVLLGRIAEAATGERFAPLAQRILIEPLGLESTALLGGAGDPLQPVPVPGYDLDLLPGGSVIAPDNAAWPSLAWTAGAFVSSAADLLTLYQAVFGGRFLGDASLAAMTAFYPCTDEDIPVQTGYGLGLRRFVIDGITLVGHTGTIAGFGAGAFFLPESATYITFTANRSRLDQIALLQELIGELRSAAML